MEIIDCGVVSYSDAWELQLNQVQKRRNDEVGDTILLYEHQPVYTVGTAFKGEIPNPLPYPIHRIERGGEITYHGPGQLVIYPIVKLTKPDVTGFLRQLESSLIELLADFGLKASAARGHTGVWINQKKIASIGIAVKHWVTFHGAALNVNPDLSHFQAIKPCGYDPDVMTSLSKELGRNVFVDEIKSQFASSKYFDENPVGAVASAQGDP